MMDPLGFALENFDAIGRWRTEDAGTPMDAYGTLPDGATFNGVPGLRRSRARGTVRHDVTEQLLTYALGRGVEYTTCRRATDRAGGRAADYRWSSIILGVVKSWTFQNRVIG